MYLNFHKYNYSLLAETERNDYEIRDKKAYMEILKKWVDDNLEEFVDRKWEIDEIHYLKEIGDFVKLLREAEQLYELGFYTGCIALLGVSAEDFSKYLSLRASFDEHITTNINGRIIDVSQFNRLQLQVTDGLISQNNHDLLDEIRLIRNNCLHYNDNFKQKPETELRNDALKVLNNLKNVLKNTIGCTLNISDFQELMNESFENQNSRNYDELVWKHRNMFSHLLNINIAQDPKTSIVEKFGLFEVTDLDDEEIELSVLDGVNGTKTGLFVWVDINDRGRDQINDQKINKGDVVIAKIYSNVDQNGQTGIWFIEKIQK